MNPNCSVEKICYGDSFGDTGVIALGNALTSNQSLKLKCLHLLLNVRFITSAGWRGLALGLSSPHVAIENLDLSYCDIDDEGAIAIVRALATTAALKKLNMSGNRSVTSARWATCFQLMLESELKLEKLDLDKNHIDDEGAEILFEFLANTPLRTLNMSYIPSITSNGWVNCFHFMLGCKPILEYIRLQSNNIDDEGAAMLVKLLAKINTVSWLHLRDNVHMTADGFSMFTGALLPSSASKLKYLELGSCVESSVNNVNDDVIICFTNALANNCTSLQDLRLGNVSSISIRGWGALATVLCDNFCNI